MSRDALRSTRLRDCCVEGQLEINTKLKSCPPDWEFVEISLEREPRQDLVNFLGRRVANLFHLKSEKMRKYIYIF